MTELERVAIEYEKCKNDPYYFFKTYCRVTTKKEMLTRKKLEGREFEEISNIFLKYFTADYQRKHFSNHISLIEKVTHEDGDIVFVLSFDNNRYDVVKTAIDLTEIIPLLRKEKLERLCQKMY